jgi:predicted Rossmann fold nucleotide-binding protein DprA/Smf involved in DNA uptake
MAQQRLTPEAVLAYSAKEWKAKFGLRAQSADYLAQNRENLQTSSAELARLLRAYSIRVLSIEDGNYPARLDENDDSPPPILYAHGNYALLDPNATESDADFTFALALSNDASQHALIKQDEISMSLARAGGAVVTGHDRLPYKLAALSAQRRDRPIVYVFDRGMREALGPQFDRPPFSAARIREAVFDPTLDLAISPFRLDDHGLGANNRRRDSLVFALADAIVAIEVRKGGNMARTCLSAHAQGRPVYVLASDNEGNRELQDAGCPLLPSSIEEIKQAAQNRNIGPTPFV